MDPKRWEREQRRREARANAALSPVEKVKAGGMMIAILAGLAWAALFIVVVVGAALTAGPLGVLIVGALAWFTVANVRRDKDQGIKRY